MTPPGFAGRWFRWNTIAWLLGFLPFSFIAHGITGGHGADLTPAQYVAHSTAMAVAALIVAWAQRRTLRDYVSLSWVRIPIAAAAFVAASWAGNAIPLEVDPDILVGFLVLGCVVWIGAVEVRRYPLAAAIAVLSFPAAAFLIELGLVILASLLQFTPNLQTYEWQHAIFWITVGGGTGLLGGWWSGLALSRMLPTGMRPSAVQQPVAADGVTGRR